MVKIRKHLVSSAIANNVTFNGTNPKTYIVIHETANKNKGANADAHARLQANGNSRNASWHYQVDDKEIVQSFNDSAQCWHAGNANYNRNSIGVEICVNSDGSYLKAVNNAIELVKYLMDKYSISVSNVIQHNTASGKNCPRYLRAGSRGTNWTDFISKISGKSTSTVKPSKPQVKPSTSTSGGLGLVDWMKSQGMNSTFNNRAKLAGQYGINGYKGTALQNNSLLAKLKAGKPKQSAPANTSKKGNQTTNSIVTYLNSIGTDSSYANRAKLAKQYGISNYKGTAKQNTTLLNKLRGGGGSSKPTQSINQMATRIINDKNAPTGHAARRKWLGIDNATYQKVRAEVNRRL